MDVLPTEVPLIHRMAAETIATTAAVPKKTQAMMVQETQAQAIGETTADRATRVMAIGETIADRAIPLRIIGDPVAIIRWGTAIPVLLTTGRLSATRLDQMGQPLILA